jgi:hypothetical protein
VVLAGGCLLALTLIAGAGRAAPDVVPPATHPPTAPTAPTAPTPALPTTPTATAAGKGVPSPPQPQSNPGTGGKAGAVGAPKTVAASSVREAAEDDIGDDKTKPKTKAKSKSKAKAQTKTGEPPEASSAIGEGPSPASPPPLTMAGLRDQTHRDGVAGTIDPSMPARSKLEQMLAEIAKARVSLHEDTARLEAMMTTDNNDDSTPPSAAGGGAGVAGATKGAAKNPLDVLAKALRGIKPEQAAPIVSRLDKRLAAKVLQRMPPVDAGKILGAMKPDTAAELATQIAMRAPPGEAKR